MNNFKDKKTKRRKDLKIDVFYCLNSYSLKVLWSYKK